MVKKKKVAAGKKRTSSRVRTHSRVRSTGKPLKKKTPLRRVPTGIQHFDPLIEGGLEHNSINLLVGGSGSGKTILAMQFLMEGLRRGEPCLYITFEEQKAQFYENMREFKWDLENYEKKGLFVFLEYSPIKVKTMLEEGGGAIENIILTKKISRLVIDSLTSFALLFEDELTRREAALELFSMIRDWRCTSLLTFEEESIQRGGRTASEALESDSIIMLYSRQLKGDRKHFVEVVKMRGTQHSTKVYPYDIGRTGVVIGKSPVKGSFV